LSLIDALKIIEVKRKSSFSRSTMNIRYSSHRYEQMTLWFDYVHTLNNIEMKIQGHQIEQTSIFFGECTFTLQTGRIRLDSLKVSLMKIEYFA